VGGAHIVGPSLDIRGKGHDLLFDCAFDALTGQNASQRLLIFGRLPEPGVAKTRLAPFLSEEDASDLYQSFLDDALGIGDRICAPELWVPERPGAFEQLSLRYPRASVRLQPEGSLGDKLIAAFEASFSEGIDYVLAVGSDHPTLPAEYLTEGFCALRRTSAVLGPTDDGGYYAVGLKRQAWPEASRLFLSAPWSTPTLLQWTRERAIKLGLLHEELPTWYDVDRPEDLGRMEDDLDIDSATGRVWASIKERADPGRGMT
jgi:rSAM/selenodomain-associated transferase 1